MAEKIDRWVYKSSIEQTIIVRGTTVTQSYDNQGNPIPGSQVKRTPIKLKFENCHAIVDKEFSKRNHIGLDELLTLIEDNPGYGRNFVCIQDPRKGKELSKKEEKELEDSKKQRGVKVIQGVRN